MKAHPAASASPLAVRRPCRPDSEYETHHLRSALPQHLLRLHRIGRSDFSPSPRFEVTPEFIERRPALRRAHIGKSKRIIWRGPNGIRNVPADFVRRDIEGRRNFDIVDVISPQPRTHHAAIKYHFPILCNTSVLEQVSDAQFPTDNANRNSRLGRPLQTSADLLKRRPEHGSQCAGQRRPTATVPPGTVAHEIRGTEGSSASLELQYLRGDASCHRLKRQRITK